MIFGVEKLKIITLFTQITYLLRPCTRLYTLQIYKFHIQINWFPKLQDKYGIKSQSDNYQGKRCTANIILIKIIYFAFVLFNVARSYSVADKQIELCGRFDLISLILDYHEVYLPLRP